jgi:hypothetical protein
MPSQFPVLISDILRPRLPCSDVPDVNVHDPLVEGSTILWPRKTPASSQKSLLCGGRRGWVNFPWGSIEDWLDSPETARAEVTRGQ